ncbi:lytic transglycosylase domain-containing protein [Thioalkalivibrio thiocyanodenitrificans]|uniref:lytic transglycosylase domain-containing protein n=1 Tax=Thioalkalivibrio thiocyanodenitrificans TaxID=243063 RepID=UPI0003700366|nr:lytic transglycosylase domain-containing protein [Thioalkalivibrio thiocyanodenitrificans]
MKGIYFCFLVSCTVALLAVTSPSQSTEDLRVNLDLPEPQESVPHSRGYAPSAGELAQSIAQAYPSIRGRELEAAGWILRASARTNVPWEILSALIATESSYRLNVRSATGAVGPAQVQPLWWDSLGYDLKDPAQNILAAAVILQEYRKACGDWDCALRAYNVGLTAHLAGQQRKAEERYIRKIDLAMAKFD